MPFGWSSRRGKHRRRQRQQCESYARGIAAQYQQMVEYLNKTGAPPFVRQQQLNNFIRQHEGRSQCWSYPGKLQGAISKFTREAQQQKGVAAAKTILESLLKQLPDGDNIVKGRGSGTLAQQLCKVIGKKDDNYCRRHSWQYNNQLNQVTRVWNQIRHGAPRHMSVHSVNSAIQTVQKWLAEFNKQKEAATAKKAAESKAAEKKAVEAKAAAAKAAASKSGADKAAAAAKASDAKNAAVKASQAAAAKGDTAEAAKQMSLAHKIAALEAKIRGFEVKEAERRGYEKARKEFRARRHKWRDKKKPAAPAKAPVAKAAPKVAAPKPKPKPLVCKDGLRKRGDKCVPPPRPRWRCPRGKKPNFPSNWYDPAAQKRYTAKYKDVAAAVRGGSIRSGLFHYACTGSREGRNWSGYSERPGYLAGIFANWDQE